MKKLTITLLILVSCSLFCSQNSGEQANEPKTEQKAKNGENLIINDEQLDFSKHKVTFIELGADRCIPCKAMQPIMREIAQEYKGTIQVVFYDVWKTPKYAKDYGIQMIPTQVFIDKNGDEIFRHIGFYAKDEIIKMLKEKGIL
ncbi:MAG: thioredoxin family protein [Candidatus Aminicenantes bacterium]|nr:thioredoxin family protein [Candidatus Aminicenantes bacterium]